MATFSPSMKPASFNPWRNARRRAVSVDDGWSKPTTGIVPCCARAASGHAAAAPPSSEMKSRRFMPGMASQPVQPVCRTLSLARRRVAGPWDRPEIFLKPPPLAAAPPSRGPRARAASRRDGVRSSTDARFPCSVGPHLQAWNWFASETGTIGAKLAPAIFPRNVRHGPVFVSPGIVAHALTALVSPPLVHWDALVGLNSLTPGQGPAHQGHRRSADRGFGQSRERQIHLAWPAQSGGGASRRERRDGRAAHVGHGLEDGEPSHLLLP